MRARNDRRGAIADAEWRLRGAAEAVAGCERALVGLVIADGGSRVMHPETLRQRSAVIAARAAEEARRAELKALQEAPMK